MPTVRQAVGTPHASPRNMTQQPVPKKPEVPGKPDHGPETPGKPEPGPEAPGKHDKPGREIIVPPTNPQAPHVHRPEVPRPPGTPSPAPPAPRWAHPPPAAPPW